MANTPIELPTITAYSFDQVITTSEELRNLLGHPGQGAIDKELSFIDAHAKNFIEHSPFVLIATADAAGRVDVSPKGDPAGFVKVLNDKTLAVPDRPGNRRLDGFENVLSNPHVGLIFLIPGVEETLRVNGRATLVQDQALLDTMTCRSKAPTIALAVEADEVYFHCAKAFRRSNLWKPETWPDHSVVPTLGQILLDQTKADTTVEEYDRYLEEAYQKNLY